RESKAYILHDFTLAYHRLEFLITVGVLSFIAQVNLWPLVLWLVVIRMPPSTRRILIPVWLGWMILSQIIWYIISPPTSRNSLFRRLLRAFFIKILFRTMFVHDRFDISAVFKPSLPLRTRYLEAFKILFNNHTDIN